MIPARRLCKKADSPALRSDGTLAPDSWGERDYRLRAAAAHLVAPALPAAERHYELFAARRSAPATPPPRPRPIPQWPAPLPASCIPKVLPERPLQLLLGGPLGESDARAFIGLDLTRRHFNVIAESLLLERGNPPTTDADFCALLFWLHRADMMTCARTYGHWGTLLGYWSEWWPVGSRMARRAIGPGLKLRSQLRLSRDAADLARRVRTTMDPLDAAVLSDALEESGLPPELVTPYRDDPDSLTRGDWLLSAVGPATAHRVLSELHKLAAEDNWPPPNRVTGHDFAGAFTGQTPD